MDTENNKITDEKVIKQTAEQNQEINFDYSHLLPPKPLFELEKGDTTFAICAAACCVFISVFGIFGGFALGFTVSSILLTILFGLYFAYSGKARFFPVICGALALANSVVFITTTNFAVRFFSVVISFLLSLICFDGIINGNARGNRATVGVFCALVSSIDNVGVSVKSLFSGTGSNKKSAGKVIIGLLCAIPVLIIVIPLLISSDAAFSGMMSEIFTSSGDTFTTILKIIFGIVISLFVISYGFSLKNGRISKIKESKFAGIDNIYIISFLSAITVCYLLYLFSQLAYFFSAFSGFLPDGEITYAQYARKGFFEMCVIAVINLGLVFLSLLLAKKRDGKVCVGVKVLATFITAFTLIIIATAISKMVLYINTYGMTVLRITTSAFMLFLAVVFISVILRIYITKINIVKTTLVTAGIIVLLLGTVNVDGVCAKYNYEAYKAKKLTSIDIEAMYNLGDEGIPYLARLACSKNKDIAKEAQNYMAKAYIEDYFVDMHFAEGFSVDALYEQKKYKSFSYFSVPRNRAYNTLYTFLEQNPEFDDVCLGYLKTHESFFDLF